MGLQFEFFENNVLRMFSIVEVTSIPSHKHWYNLINVGGYFKKISILLIILALKVVSAQCVVIIILVIC